MEKEEYMKNAMSNLRNARTSLVGYILKRDGFIGKGNDKEVCILDRCIDKIEKSLK